MRACAPRALPVGYDGYGFQPTSLDRDSPQTYRRQIPKPSILGTQEDAGLSSKTGGVSGKRSAN